MLTVYKASAGSGKTFRLAIEYIKHLIISPDSYRGILAVTFTNKATGEMKLRILSQLYGLAHGLPDSKAYMGVLLDELTQLQEREPFTRERVDSRFIARRAAEALTRLLHDFTFFRVETIDKFFQRVLRNLARELDLARNLRVELGGQDVVHGAVDSWIDSLQGQDSQMGWIMDFVNSTMDDNQRWNIIGGIKQFSEMLLSDDYKRHARALTAALDDKGYAALTAALWQCRRGLSARYNAVGRRLLAIMGENGLGEKVLLQGSRGIVAFINQMATVSLGEMKVSKYAEQALNPDDVEAVAWISPKKPAALRQACRDALRPAFLTAMEHFDDDRRLYASVATTLEHLPKLRMLRAIQDEMSRSNAEENRFLLADTQTLLSSMIDGSDTPFIFEKIGSRLRNIMIDEFQDTSSVQWANFKVLLSDCMSHGHDCLIVGDVKQSIYRWRSGDWRLLNALGRETAKGDGAAAFPAAKVRVEPLKVNRRSSVRVIRFNNAFFTQAVLDVCGEIAKHSSPEEVAMVSDAYGDVSQDYPDAKAETGHVEMRLLPPEAVREDTLSIVADTIVRLVGAGADVNDIAIIVRNNNVIPDIVRYCTTACAASGDSRLSDLHFVTDEAYHLDASVAVCVIIDALRCLADPHDSVAKARLSLAYQRHVLRSEAQRTELLDDQRLPQGFIEGRRELYAMPLYQLCEELYRLFDIAALPGQGAYVCAFFDALADFLQRYVADIAALLDYWDDTMHEKKIETPDTGGIRILTIHKSKGLEYQHVIVPFCDWELEKHSSSSILWCVPPADTAPMNRLPAIPISYVEKNMSGTVYEPDYWHEHMQNMVDNLNMLYVAFTRAVSNLFVIGRKRKAGNDNCRYKLLEDVLPDVAAALGAAFADGTFSYGDICVEARKESETTANVFLGTAERHDIEVRTGTHTPQFRESNESRDYLAQDAEGGRQAFINLGTAIHRLLAAIATPADIPAALRAMEMEGLFDGHSVTAADVERRVRDGIARPDIAQWFADGWRLHNECTIVDYDADTDTVREHRPDRVMTRGSEAVVVDYKLYTLCPAYHDQVRRYMRLLRHMGYRRVTGFLWAVMSGKVEQVMLEA